MRALLFALALGVTGAALLPARPAAAWYDAWGRWHPNFYRRPVLVVRPPVVVVPRPYPYAHWVPPHWNRWGRWVPGHWA